MGLDVQLRCSCSWRIKKWNFFFFFSCFWCFNITIVRFIRIGFNCSIGHDKFRICSLNSCRKWACAHLIQCSYSCIGFVNRVCTIVYILAWLVKINCLCHQISGLAIMSATFQMRKKKKVRKVLTKQLLFCVSICWMKWCLTHTSKQHHRGLLC